jgi:hypothetical protein
VGLTLAILQGAVAAEVEKWRRRPADEVLALIPSKEVDHEYEWSVAGSRVGFSLELLQVRSEAVDLMLEAQPIDDADIEAIRVQRAPGQQGGWSDDELGIASMYFWIERK